VGFCGCALRDASAPAVTLKLEIRLASWSRLAFSARTIRSVSAIVPRRSPGCVPRAD
jgi:hypothetical protein